ncbi:MAG: glycosyltransferase [Candidatus Micrarchaeia archaeon]
MFAHSEPLVEAPRQKVLVAIPAFNEEKTVDYVLGRAAELKSGGAIWDFVLVNDGSTDRTVGIAKSMRAEVLDIRERAGKGNAILQGMLLAKKRGAEIFLMIDADLHRGFTKEQVNGILAEFELPPVCPDDPTSEAARRIGRKTEMVVHPWGEQNGGNYSYCTSYSGFRAIRMDALGFLFVKNPEGEWVFAKSKPAMRFIEAAQGYGLETILNLYFRKRLRMICKSIGPAEASEAIVKERDGRLPQGTQEHDLKKSRSLLNPRFNNWYDLVKKRGAQAVLAKQ